MAAATRPRRETSHGPETTIDQTEERHQSAAIGFSALDLQQGRNEGKKSGLKGTGEK